MRSLLPDTFVTRLVRLVQWSVFVLGLSAVFHVLVVIAIPNVTVMSSTARISDAGGLNEALHSGTPGADQWLIERHPNPDILTSVCAFNLALGPVRLEAQIPGALWSVSIYGDNRQLVHRLDESDISGHAFKAILAGTGQHFANEDEIEEIHISRFTGIIVFRSIIDTSRAIEPQEKLNKTTRCEALNNALSKRHY